MILENYTQFGGIHPETATYTNILASQNVLAPHTKRPYSEAMILGIAGGIGCGYILWEFKKYDSAILVMGFQNKWNYPVEFLQNLSNRLGVQTEFKETGGKQTASKQLTEVIENGRAAIAWIDQESLPYFHLRPMYNGCFGHYVSVYGLDNDTVYVDDRAQTPVTVDSESFANARARIGSYKNKLLTLQTDTPNDDLPAAIMAGLQDCVAYMSSRSQTFAPPTYRKWARLMTDNKNKKGWPVVFKDKTGLFSTLRSLHEGIKLFGTKGGGLRLLYADFLHEAATVLPNPALKETAVQYQTLGKQWMAFADSVLSDEIAPLAETKRLLSQKYALFLEHGNTKEAELAQINAQLSNMEEELNPNFPSNNDEMQALFAQMQTDLTAIYEAETAALDSLKVCLN